MRGLATGLLVFTAAFGLAGNAPAQDNGQNKAAPPSRHMEDAEFAHCYAIGLAEKANVQDGIDFMQRPDQKGNFTDDDVQKMQDFIKGLDDDYFIWFDSNQAYDQSEVDAWKAKDHNEIDAELDHCFDLMEGELQATMDEIDADSSSSSSSR